MGSYFGILSQEDQEICDYLEYIQCKGIVNEKLCVPV